MKMNSRIANCSLRKFFMLIACVMGTVLPANAQSVAKLFKNDGSLAGTYSSILNAFEALTEDWMTIQMIADETITDTSYMGCISVPLTKPVTVDLNGHTIRINKEFWIKETEIDIVDNSSEKNGTIRSSDKAIFYLDRSKLTIKDGLFYSTELVVTAVGSMATIYGGKYNCRYITDSNLGSTVYGGYFKYNIDVERYSFYFTLAKGYVKTESGRKDWPYMVVPAGAKLTYYETTMYVPSYWNMTIDLKDDDSDPWEWLSEIEMMPCKEATDITVTIKKNFANTNWHDFFAPFDFTLTSDLLQDFEFAKIWDTEVNTKDKSTYIEFIKLNEGTKITGYTPILIKPKTAGKQDIVFKGVTPLANTQKSIDCSNIRQKFTFTSVMSKTDLTGKYALDSETNTLVYVNDEYEYVYPLRFYMKVEDKATGASVQNMKVAMRMIGDETTAINDNTDDGADTTGDVFNLQGVKMGTSAAGLPTGVYIQNGRKIMVK